MSNKIIGISGIGGAGKTTLSRHLSTLLKATLVAWDDFEAISTGATDDLDGYEQWMHHAEWDYSHLAEILETLKHGKPILHPFLKQVLAPTHYIVFESPLGRLHTQTGQFIDTWVHLEVPLDIALARRTIRDFSASDKTKEQLMAELKYYLAHSQKFTLEKDLKKGADFILDGMLTVEEQGEKIVDYMEA